MKKILYIGNYLEREQHNPSYMHTLGNLLNAEGFTVKFSSAKRNKTLRLLDMCLSVIKNIKWANVVLIDTYSTQNFYYALTVSQLCRLIAKDYICILHGGNLPRRLKKNPKISKVIFQNAKLNIAPSTYLKNTFKDEGYNNLKLIPNIITLENYPYINKLFDSPRLLWVRSFSKIYNPALAIQVLKKLKMNGFEATLCMVGPDNDGSMQQTMNLADKLKVEVRFPGRLTKLDWIDLSKDYNIFINTTNFDNTPVSVIEAMALGLPIVSTNVGGMPNLIQDGIHGLLVEPRNANEMAKAIIKIMQDGTLRLKIIDNARSRAEQFDWKEIRNEWKRILSN